MLTTILSTLLVAGFRLTVRADEVVCYAPDGVTVAPNDTYVPCNKLGITQVGVYSSCCALDGDPDQRDLCATTGLCLNNGVIRREYCTDPTWSSAACVDICTDSASGGSANGVVEMTPCTDGTYCCGRQNLSCCGTDSAVVVPVQPGVVLSNDTGSGSQSADPYKNATIALAVVLGVVAVVSAGMMAWLFTRNKSLNRQLAEKPGAPTSTPAPNVEPYRDSYVAGSPPHLSPSPAYSQYNKGPSDPGANIHEASGGNLHRYSELDATVASRSEIGSPPPPSFSQEQPSPHGSPLPSPRLAQ